MRLNSAQRTELAAEIKKFVTELNLNEQQTEKLRAFLAEGRERLKQFRQENPNVTREQIAETFAAMSHKPLISALLHFSYS